MGVTFELTTDGPGTDALLADLRQILDDLQLDDRVRIDVDRAVTVLPTLACVAWAQDPWPRDNCHAATQTTTPYLTVPR